MHCVLSNTLSAESTATLNQATNVLAVLPLPIATTQEQKRGRCKNTGETGIVHTGLTLLNSDTALSEAWLSNEPVIKGKTGRIQWSQSKELLFAAIWLTATECKQLTQATESAYNELLAVIEKQGYPHAFRFWNYLPNINQGDSDLERYKLFCTGRLKAFQNKGIAEEDYPSASALGHHTDGAIIYVMSAKVKGRHYNNQHQVNAYDYPREYGISSPSFSRATQISLGQSDLFFISGTASIIGHKTLHKGDIEQQLITTISNIKHLLDNRRSQKNSLPNLQSMKVYLRHKEDFAHAQQQLDDAFPETLKIYTLADICRRDLLVEVECFCG